MLKSKRGTFRNGALRSIVFCLNTMLRAMQVLCMPHSFIFHLILTILYLTCIPSCTHLIIEHRQKEIIRRCNKESKPVIVATQMMESMTQNSRPTRAEASDVYNAVLDGADAVMLSGESSVGKHPVEAVAIMDEIVRVAQGQMPQRNPNDFDSSEKRITETMAHAAYTIAEEFKALNVPGKIIVLTRNGHAARLISKYRPALPILAFSENIRTVRELNLVWGVLSHFVPDIAGLDVQDRAVRAINIALESGYIGGDVSHVCVLAPSGLGTKAGYLAGVYDIKQLQESGAIEWTP